MKEFNIKKQDKIFWIITSLVIAGLIAGIILYVHFGGNPEFLFNLALISSFAIILALIQIKKSIDEHYNRGKFDIERIGKRGTYFYLTIINKTDEVAFNCRGNLEIGEHRADAVWSDPSHPREIDIPLNEDLDLFSLILTDHIIFPLGVIQSSLKIKGHFLPPDELRKAKRMEDATELVDWEKYKIYKMDVFSNKELKITLTARNANKFIIILKNLTHVIRLVEKNTIVIKKDLEKANLISYI